MNPATDRQDGPPPEGRAALRARLIALREALPSARHAAASATISAQLDGLLGRVSPWVVGFCWPYRGEFDCRAVVSAWLASDARRAAALPVIVTPAAPMAFRRWTPQCKLVAGRFGILAVSYTHLTLPTTILV